MLNDYQDKDLEKEKNAGNLSSRKLVDSDRLSVIAETKKDKSSNDIEDEKLLKN